MSFVSPLQLKKLMTQPTVIKKTQSHKVNNENWVQGRKMDEKIDDLFNKIKRVTSDWNSYVIHNPLGQTQQNVQRVPLIMVPSVNQVKHNPERSTTKSKTTKVSLQTKYSTQRIERQISQGPPPTSSRNQVLHKAQSLQLPLPFVRVKNKRSVQISDFKLGKSLGSGKFGEVYIGIHKATNAIYAIKKIIKGTLKEYEMVDQFRQEVKLHSKISHPNITKMYGCFDDDYHVFMIMEYVPGKQLMQYRKKGQAFTSKVIYQLLRAVQYLHRAKIAHRDIKPQNILLANGVVKLCDFGWAADCSNGMKRTFCGTMDYVSPEVLDQKEYYLQVDLWSVGILAFQLIAGFAPFPDQTPRFKCDKFTMVNPAITQIEKLNLVFPKQFSESAIDFIQKLLKKNPNERMSVYECYSHQFIQMYREEKGPDFREFEGVLGLGGVERKSSRQMSWVF